MWSINPAILILAVTSSYRLNTLPHHRVKTGILAQLFLHSSKSWHSRHSTDDHHHSLSGSLKYIFRRSGRKTNTRTKQCFQATAPDSTLDDEMSSSQSSSLFTLWMIHGWDSCHLKRNATYTTETRNHMSKCSKWARWNELLEDRSLLLLARVIPFAQMERAALPNWNSKFKLRKAWS